MDWYKTLDIHGRINAKVCFELLIGSKFESVSCMFSMKERIDMMYNKLVLEGFAI